MDLTNLECRKSNFKKTIFVHHKMHPRFDKIMLVEKGREKKKKRKNARAQNEFTKTTSIYVQSIINFPYTHT